MAGYCGMCGRPRAADAAFCMHCGHKFAEAQQTCPTCGQPWPQAAPAPVTVEPATSAAPSCPATAEPVPTSGYGRGAYSSGVGQIYFDGDGWFHARGLAGGLWVPDPSRPVELTDDVRRSLSRLFEEQVSSQSNLPRGPRLGPDYVPGRDCGNCGFELDAGATECARCGSRNIGATFQPGA